MGKLIKNHWARLIVLTASLYHVAASLEGFFWPKIFWDWLTTNLDTLVKPIPILQIINIVLAFIIVALEWPLERVTKFTAIHSRIETRLILLPFAAFWAILMYQGTNPALYYIIGIIAYFWAYCDGEVVLSSTCVTSANSLQVICAVPWTLPPKKDKEKRQKV